MPPHKGHPQTPTQPTAMHFLMNAFWSPFMRMSSKNASKKQTKGGWSLSIRSIKKVKKGGPTMESSASLSSLSIGLHTDPTHAIIIMTTSLSNNTNMFSTDVSPIDPCQSPILFKPTSAAATLTLDPSYDATEAVDHRDAGSRSLESVNLTSVKETDPVNDFAFDSIQDLAFLAFTEQTQRRLFEITHVKLSRKKQRLLLRALAANAMDAILEMKPEMEALFWRDSKLSHAMPVIQAKTE